MNNTITKNKKVTYGVRAYSQEHYPIYRNRGTAARGRKPSKLGITLRLLNVGDEFFYPYTTANSVHRLARQLDIYVRTTRMEGGFWVMRVEGIL